jgi:hypothetical protein
MRRLLPHRFCERKLCVKPFAERGGGLAPATIGLIFAGGKTMADRPKEQDRRKARLAEALRANLQKRKAQARSRRAGEADARPDGPAGAAPRKRSD